MQGIVRISMKVLRVSTFCIGAMSIAGASEAQGLGEQEGETNVQRAYVKTALVYQWNRKNDYVTPTALLKAAIMARQGRSKEDIISAVTNLREEHMANVDMGLRREWQVNEDYRTMIRHVGGLAGRVFGNAAEIVADLGIMTYEHLARDPKVIEASKAIGLMYQNVAGAEENIADRVMETWSEYEVFRNVYAEQFEPELQIRPTDSINQINMKIPDFSTHTKVGKLLEIVSEHVPTADREMRGLKIEVRELKMEVRSILNEIRNRQQQDNLNASTELERERERDRVHEGLRAGAFFAASVIGFDDPKLGRQVQAVSSAAFQAHDASRDFKNATDSSKDLTGAASLALTANYIGVALTLASAFQDSGPSPELFILEEIANLRKDTENIGIEYRDRFGIVERQLSKVYARLDEGFENLEIELLKQTRSLNFIVANLNDIQNQISGGTALIFDRTVLLEDLIVELEIADCVNWKWGMNIAISEERFGECLFKMQTLFSLSYLKARQIKRENADSSGSLSEWLREKPNDLATVSADSLEVLSRLNLPDSIPGPIDWQVAAKLYTDFLEAWPQHLGLMKDKGLSSLNELMKGAHRVNALRSTAQQQLEDFSNGTTANAIERLLARIRARKIVLDEAIQVYKEDYKEQVINNPGMIAITPIDDEERCAFHHTQAKGYDGKGYIAELPENIRKIVPLFVRQLIQAEIGELEYCLENFYMRGKGETGFNIRQQETLLASAASTLVRGVKLLADDAGKKYHNSPGPYTMVLRIDYVLDSLECKASLNQGRILQILELSASDSNKMKGGAGDFGAGPLPAKLVAPKKIWDKEWRNKFLNSVMNNRNVDAENCLKEQLTARLEERWMEMGSDWIVAKLSDENNMEKRNLRTADKETEIDYALLSHWIWSGYADVARENDLLARLIDGTASGPTLVSALDGVLVQRESLVWEAPERYLIGLKVLKEVLQSKDIKLAYGRPKDNFGVNEIMKRIKKLSNRVD